MEEKYLELLKQKIGSLSLEESILRDLYLSKLASGEVQGPPVGYSSIDKTWLRNYDDKRIMEIAPELTIYENLYENNKDYLDDVAFRYYGTKITYGELFEKIENTAKSFINAGVKYNFRKELEILAKIDATRIGEKNINFKVNIASDIPYELIGDKIHIKEVINNLLTNAIKYTEEGEIELNATCINQNNTCRLIISVRDTGRGIKAEYINKLFTKFERLDIEKNTTAEGTGLGLAITKALVEMMDGKINVQSQFGKGSLFVVQIPQKISQMSNPNQTIELDITAPKVVSDNIDKERKTDAIRVIDSSNFDGKRILIVDDNKLNIKVARRALQDFNFEIDECYDGVECINKVSNGNEYDLILMDIMMPNMSGETAFVKLKENPNFKIPTIALTADAISGAQEKYKSEGFIDYIAKPFSKDQIKEKLDKVFNDDVNNSDTLVI